MGDSCVRIHCSSHFRYRCTPSVIKHPSSVAGDYHLCKGPSRNNSCITFSVVRNSSAPKLSSSQRLLQPADLKFQSGFFTTFELRNGVLSVRCKKPPKPWRLQVQAIDFASSKSQSTGRDRDSKQSGGNERPGDQKRPKSLDSDNELNKSMKFRRRVYDVKDWTRHRSSTRHFRHVLSISSSRVIRSLALPVLTVTSFAALVGVWNEGVMAQVFPSWVPLLHVPSLPFQLTAPALALLLVFRTNASYARFDEARKTWGLNATKSRNFARQALTWIRHPDDSEKLDKLLCLCMAFPFSMKHHLTEEPGLEADLRSLLQEEDVEKILDSSNRPIHILQMITEICFTCSLSDMAMAQMDRNLTSFHDNFGTCERILQTPIPLSYTRLTSRFLFIWHATLPLGLWDQCSWVVIPATFISAAALFCIEEVGVLVEEPLCMISLDYICETIRQDIEGLQQAHCDSRELYRKFYRKEDSSLGVSSVNGSSLLIED